MNINDFLIIILSVGAAIRVELVFQRLDAQLEVGD
jgi:hypothetical protein